MTKSSGNLAVVILGLIKDLAKAQHAGDATKVADRADELIAAIESNGPQDPISEDSKPAE